MTEREATISCRDGRTATYDPGLVDYLSDAFSAGYREGRDGSSDVPQRHPGAMADAEWASYCEGFMMGWCEQ